MYAFDRFHVPEIRSSHFWKPLSIFLVQSGPCRFVHTQSGVGHRALEEWDGCDAGNVFDLLLVSCNKAIGEEVNRFVAATLNDVDQVFQTARNAFPVWSGETRSNYLCKAAEIMKRRRREMAECEAMETGKPVFDTYEPYGVAAIIALLNFPIHLLRCSLASALAIGNTCVTKASSITPTAAAIMGEVFGPVLSVCKYKDIEEVIRHANDTEFGLGPISSAEISSKLINHTESER